MLHGQNRFLSQVTPQVPSPVLPRAAKTTPRQRINPLSKVRTRNRVIPSSSRVNNLSSPHRAHSISHLANKVHSLNQATILQLPLSQSSIPRHRPVMSPPVVTPLNLHLLFLRGSLPPPQAPVLRCLQQRLLPHPAVIVHLKLLLLPRTRRRL